MRKVTNLIGKASVAACWIVSFFFFLCGCSSNDQKSLPKASVTEFIVEPKTLPVVFEFIGFAESSHPVQIRARVEGYLDKIAYDEGEVVNEGDLLFQLDPRQYQAEVDQAKGEVARQEAILENAKLTVNRLSPLYEQKAASKKDLDNAVASLQSAEATLLSAKAKLYANELNLSYTTIRSPITGAANKSRFRQGALITPSIDNLLTTISSLNPIWVYFTVSDNEILQATRKMFDNAITFPQEKEYEVEVVLSDGSTFPHKGKVNFSSPTYDQNTGSLLVRAVFQNPEAILRPGQFVRVRVYGAKRPQALFVPKVAVMQKKTGNFVYLINSEGKVIAQDVAAGEWYEEYQIITSGLKPGDRVIVDGINKVFPGMPVHVTGDWSSKKIR